MPKVWVPVTDHSALVQIHGFNPNLEEAPKDATMLKVLAVFEENGLEDDFSHPQPSIAFSDEDFTGDKGWKLVGWDWSHDCFTQGKGKIIGWKPFIEDNPIVHEMPDIGTSITAGMEMYKEIKVLLGHTAKVIIRIPSRGVYGSDFLSAVFGQFLEDMSSKKFWDTFEFVNCPMWLMGTMETVVDNAVVFYNNQQARAVAKSVKNP